MTETLRELKPCPFCGGPATGTRGAVVGCERCDVWFEESQWELRPPAAPAPADLRERVARAACNDTEKGWRESSEDWHEHWLAAADRILALVDRPAITGRDVHREWRDGMLAQGRKVAPERMEWDTLKDEDQELDRRIAARLSLVDSRPEPVDDPPMKCGNCGAVFATHSFDCPNCHEPYPDDDPESSKKIDLDAGIADGSIKVGDYWREHGQKPSPSVVEQVAQELYEWANRRWPECREEALRIIRITGDAGLRADAIRLRNCLRALTDGTGDGDAKLIEEGRVAVIATGYLEGRFSPPPEETGLREALQFYASPANWQNDSVDIGVGSQPIPESSEVAIDKGSRARAALSPRPEKEA